LREVTTSGDDKGRARTGRTDCAECGAALTEGQRYCLRCGARHGELPAAVAGQLPAMLARKRGEELPVADEPEVEAPAEPVAEERNYAAVSAYMPSPRVAAVAVLGMLGLGVLLGSATSQFAQSAGLTSILLEAEPPPPAAEPAEEEEFTEEEVPEVEEAPEAIPSSVPELPPPAEEVPEPAPPPEPPPDPPAEEPLPEVKHLFLVVLGENGFEETFGKTSPAPYLNTTLPAEGELLPNYFAVAQGGLANQIALLSGQGPTAETTAGCPTYADVAPATVSAEGQVEGNGCVYPSTTPSLPAQLTKAKLKWKAYVEDIGNGAAAGQPPTCRHPALGSQDPNQTPMPGDAYLTPRNPFVYFHSIVDDPRCTETDVALSQLAPDLAKAKTTPTLSYIVPNACHDGGPQPCEEGKAAGPLAVEEFLKALLPVITASPAYKEGGLIAITSGQAPQTGESPDTSSCCISPAYPNLPPPAAETVSGPVKPTGGGGKVGLLLLSQFVKPGTVDESTYSNHYTLLLSIEELFGLEPIGYAGDPALVGFEPSVYNAGEEESTTVKKRAAQSKRISSAVSRPSPTAATERVRSAQGADSAKRPSSSALSTAAR
jgi:hypothetical protein